MITVKLEHCTLADKQHSESKRQYCHVFHKPDETIDRHKVKIICYAKAFLDLPYKYRKGLIHHEIGHIVRPDIKDELAVDKVSLKWGVKVIRRSGKYGDNLEWSVNPMPQLKYYIVKDWQDYIKLINQELSKKQWEEAEYIVSLAETDQEITSKQLELIEIAFWRGIHELAPKNIRFQYGVP